VTAPAPYRIETERLVVRCYDPEDAALLKEAVDSSIEHLRPWMPWARLEPQTLDEKVELLRGFRSRFDRGGEGSLEIGYFIRADSIGQGLATEVTAVLARVGIEKCGVERIDVQVEPANERSLRIPRKLGFTQEAVLRRRLDPQENGGPRRDSVLFTLLADELAGSPCAGYEYRAFDALGREL
jgi:RimJ/RimL family protein N-acetyltransferase